MSDVLAKLKQRGFWKILIRPSEYVENRVHEISHLKEIIRKTVIELRGWDFPHIDTHDDFNVGLTWIGQEVDWSQHIESWRLYQSAQFAFFGSILDDWEDQSFWSRPGPDWRPGTTLSVFDVLARYTEAFEFAARLALGEINAESIEVSILLSGLKGRELRVNHPNRSGFSYVRTTAIKEFPYVATIDRATLVAEARDLALVAANQLFVRFNWEPGVEHLRGMQTEFWSRK
jgi:hypothetical protein